AWQSCLREVYLIALLHHVHGIAVKYHVLADVLLHVDGWYGCELIYMRVSNELEARKEDPAEVFPTPRFRVHRGNIPHQGYGRVWLPLREDVDRLRSVLAPTTLR